MAIDDTFGPPEVIAPPPAPPVAEPTMILGVLQTRCLCRRVVDIPNNPIPNVVQIELVDVPNMETTQGVKVRRTFYLVQSGLVDGKRAAFFMEGPDPNRSRLIVPESFPVDRRLIH